MKKNPPMIVEKERFSLTDRRFYAVQGRLPEGSLVTARLAGQKIPVRIEKDPPVGLMERLRPGETPSGERVRVWVALPEELPRSGHLTLTASFDGEKKRWFRIAAAALRKKQNEPPYFIEEDTVLPEGNTLVIRGWIASTEQAAAILYDRNRQKLPVTFTWEVRSDVSEMYDEAQVYPKCGFYTELKNPPGGYVYLALRTRDGRTAVHPIGTGRTEALLCKAEKYRQKGMDYLRWNGVGALQKKVAEKIWERKNLPPKYDRWYREHMPSEKVLQMQRNTAFSERAPKISVIVPLYRTPLDYLEQMVESVRSQTYSNWELCLSDGSGAFSPLEDTLKKYAEEDPRIHVVRNEEPMRIAQNTNAAIQEASGDYLAFLDHDDMLTPDALFEVAKALDASPEIRIVYSDEDKMSVRRDRFFEPHFKPDLNPDLLRTVNYICHLFVVRRDLVLKTGLLRPEYDGAQDYDLILRCTEQTDQILHIPKVLYHWRSHEDSTAENPESKRYAFEAGRRAVQDHYARLGIPARVLDGEWPGLYRTWYLWNEKPLVSILIPNKDHRKDLERCICSIEEKSTYRNYEYIIIENNSTQKETFAYYEELRKKYANLWVVTWDGPFNYSAINNFGASFAKGEYLLLLNNDTEVISPEWMEELLGYCMRQDVGAVGARLFYEDNTIQHAGVVLGFGGVAGHCFVQQPRESTGYCHRIICAQDYSAVTAACMMVKKAAFEAAGGLTEELAVAFNDVDFCLKLKKAGYLVVYNPYAQLYHYESKSRGLEDTPEKRERFRREIQTMEERWPGVFTEPDPYYNPNLSLYSQDFSLKRKFEE